MANWIEQLDASIASTLSQWDIYTTLIAVVLVAFVAYPLISYDEPDTHPLLLARQSTASAVRQKNESAVHRSLETPHGYPLKTGLNVKEAGAPRWAGGKDGDLRDVWREVMRGGTEEGKLKGLIMTVLGRDEAVEEDLDRISREINVIGKHLQQLGVKKVAIYLPNSVEYLATIFACSFYGLTPILLPYNQPHPMAFKLLNDTGAEALIAAAGNLPLQDLESQCTKLKSVTWVVEKTSRHMDWNEKPDNLDISVWHDLVEEAPDASSELPSNDTGAAPTTLITVWQNKQGQSDIVEFTQQNLVSAIGAMISALPLRQRLSSSDLVLVADSFSYTYVLCYTLAALFSHANLAINSVASPGVDLDLASRSISPTVIIASAETMAAIHKKATAGVTNAAQKLSKYTQAQAMSAGRMPTDNLLFKFLAPSATAVGNKPGTLRLILTSERGGQDTPALSSTMLSDLRIFTRARICYALTAARVAGAVSQTNVFDYRRDDATGHSHFGTPLSSVEVKLVDQSDAKVDGNFPEGEIIVSGPAVAGGEARLGRPGTFREDCTLAYA